MAELASKRKLDDLTAGPVLTWTTEAMMVRAVKGLRMGCAAHRRESSLQPREPHLPTTPPPYTPTPLQEHINRLAAIPGARVLFGGKPLNGGSHAIPAVNSFLRADVASSA